MNKLYTSIQSIPGGCERMKTIPIYSQKAAPRVHEVKKRKVKSSAYGRLSLSKKQKTYTSPLSVNIYTSHIYIYVCIYLKNMYICLH